MKPNSDKQGSKASRKRLLSLSDRVSRALRIILVALAIVLALSQLALQNDSIRRFISGVERWEGTYYQSRK